MGPVKIDRIVSVTSEDPSNPAENLLKREYNNKKWKNKTIGESQIAVILQLEKPTIIKGFDIGNENSAFIEILVGRSSSPDIPFEVLLVTSSLMTLQDAKYGINGNGVRFFKTESLNKPAANEKWDRIKIVCSQPYNKTSQYGLAFIVVHSVDSEVKEDTCPLGRFKLKEESEEPISIGALFARRKESSESDLKGAAAIRAASRKEQTNLSENKTEVKKVNGGISREATTSSDITSLKLPEGRKEEKIAKKRNKSPQNTKPKKIKDEDVNGVQKKNAAKRNSDNQTESNCLKKPKLTPKLDVNNRQKSKPFGKLMENVIFVISGFQNPLRSELRSKALAMGAKYKADWDNSCSHLICAFPNTPKFNQVRGHGKIVKKEWLEECFSRRMRLPWRRYALDRNDLSSPVSEDEIYEEVDNPVQLLQDHRRRVNSDSEDTEDEIERVRERQKQKKRESEQSRVDECKPSTSKMSIYDMDTDVEPDAVPDDRELPPLSKIFHGLRFMISDKFSVQENLNMKRYIIAHKGTLTDCLSDGVDIFITEEPEEAKEVQEEHPDLTPLTPSWIWKCHDENKQVPTSPFEPS